MVLEDELDELDSVQKDLQALCSVAQMTVSYPAWGGDADIVRTFACALESITDKICDVIENIRVQCGENKNVQ